MRFSIGHVELVMPMIYPSGMLRKATGDAGLDENQRERDTRDKSCIPSGSALVVLGWNATKKCTAAT